MRRVVSLLCMLAFAGCGGGGARSVLPPGAGVQGTGTAGGASSAAAIPTSGVGLSATSLKFVETGWHGTQIVKTTWSDDSQKAAGSSDTSVAVVSPPYQAAMWTSTNTYTASFFITPVGAGSATITFSDHNGAEYAQLTVTVVAPPSGTLYVLSPAEADGFPAAANGPTAPVRRITGFDSNAGPGQFSSAAGAAADASDGTLWVLKNFRAAGASGSNSCVANAYAAGTTFVQRGILCNGAEGYGAALPSANELDILELSNDNKPVVKRFVNFNETATITLQRTSPALGGIAVGPSGNLFVSTFDPGFELGVGNVYEFAPGAAGAAMPVRTLSMPTGNSSNGYFGAVAVAPDGTLYAVGILPGSFGIINSWIFAYPPGATTPSRTIGQFFNQWIAALAVDKGGELYAGFNANNSDNGTRQQLRIDVFAPDADGRSPTPMRSIPVPIPADTVGDRIILGLTFTPADASYSEETLSRRRALRH
jgi:hypothetical protein